MKGKKESMGGHNYYLYILLFFWKGLTLNRMGEAPCHHPCFTIGLYGFLRAQQVLHLKAQKEMLRRQA